jgi:signal transduction histidine kinase
MIEKSLRVLLVEDNPADAELAELELLKGGYNPVVTRVQTGAGMAVALATNDWDLILCDYMMPQFTGLEALELLKGTDKDVPFILISGSAGEDIAVAAMKAGAQDYFVKGKLALLVPAIQRELHEAERRAIARAQLEQLHRNEKLAALGTLLAGVAHELNNPLTVIMHQASLLQRLLAGDPRAARADMIREAVNRCSRIIQNFLALARQDPPQRVPVSVNDVVRKAIEVVGYSLRVDAIDVSLALQEPLPCVSGDPQELHQVIINLVNNAQYALRSGLAPHKLIIRSWFEAGTGRITLQVEDNAGGIPPEIRSRIFDPFFTTKPAGEGTGIGLALCHGILSAHDGTIRVESEIGTGTTFIITLPIAPGVMPVDEEPAAASSLVPALHILVVDDDPDVGGALADILSSQGHAVDVALGGKAALELLGNRAFDVVVTDMRMPDVDGPALYREAMARFPLLADSFIFITGDAFSGDTEGFLSGIGAVRLPKPCSLDEIDDALRQVVRRRAQRTQGSRVRDDRGGERKGAGAIEDRGFSNEAR